VLVCGGKTAALHFPYAVFMADRFRGKVVLITGGSSGIGRAAALAFASEGARVAIAARADERGNQVRQEIEAAGGTALFVRADVSSPEQVKSLFEQVLNAYGRLDCGFTNAAHVRRSHIGRTADLTEQQFDESIALNLKSVWLCMQLEIRQMLAQNPPGGAIVNTSSVNGLGGAPKSSLYSAAKAGILALTKSAAFEYARDGIRVNALVAGAFRTPMLEDAIEFYSQGNAETRQRLEEQFVTRTAIDRIGRPEEAAQAVLWLCSDAASYVTGNSFIVDGGLTAPVR